MTHERRLIRNVAYAICKSRTCEGANCCQWPSQSGRAGCPAADGKYDDAAIAAAMPERYLTVEDVLAVHAEFGRLDRDKVKAGMGPNWPEHWDQFEPGEAIFASREQLTRGYHRK